MSKFLTLVCNQTGQPMAIDAERIMKMRAHKNGATSIVALGFGCEVKETLVEILALLGEGQQYNVTCERCQKAFGVRGYCNDCNKEIDAIFPAPPEPCKVDGVRHMAVHLIDQIQFNWDEMPRSVQIACNKLQYALSETIAREE